MKRVSVPILFLTVLLLLSVAFARQLGEREYNKDADVKDAEHHVDYYGGGGRGWGGHPGWGGGPGWGRPGWGGGPGWGGCRYRCYYRCCSAKEYAELMQSQGIPHN
ncbi:glycine-rich protein DC7.1-like [Nymphaea colorata]|uniref:glycine-rich protein DC7.1-like n=1 Tax=Nymphaea colorata TaxID=210225 RepID=UPI00129E2318|nr:glycine-rich protein DC7.1-like [Nymphaea colorata]